jgi:ribonuclease VapC
MIVDTSALVAILLQESDAFLYAQALSTADTLFLSSVTRVELSLVMEGRKGDAGCRDTDALLSFLSFEIAPFTERQANLAIEAFRRFGRGRHPAALNFGDCFSYALAVELDKPLLFKGDDFRQTDVRVALLSKPRL